MINEGKAKKALRRSWFFAFLFYLSAGAASAQTDRPSAQTGSFTLEQCYQLAEATYPLSRQRGLIEKTRDYTIDNLSKGVYPQLNVSGTGTYQSDVTKISVP